VEGLPINGRLRMRRLMEVEGRWKERELVDEVNKIIIICTYAAALISLLFIINVGAISFAIGQVADFS
jgi:hypothetical protein